MAHDIQIAKKEVFEEEQAEVSAKKEEKEEVKERKKRGKKEPEAPSLVGECRFENSPSRLNLKSQSDNHF